MRRVFAFFFAHVVATCAVTIAFAVYRRAHEVRFSANDVLNDFFQYLLGGPFVAYASLRRFMDSDAPPTVGRVLGSLGYIVPLLVLYLVFTRLLIRPRPRAGFCAQCGYDLRASPERCPECGATPIAT